MESREKLIAKDLLSIKAVFFRPDEPFIWAIGIKSPVYCDNRLTLTAPEVRTDVENALAAVVREEYPDCEVLMGTSTAGIAHAAIVGHIKSATGTAKLTRDIIFEKALYQASCKAAIKAGREYPEEHIEWLVAEMMKLPDITFCPHGRPVALELTKKNLDHQFERT